MSCLPIVEFNWTTVFNLCENLASEIEDAWNTDKVLGNPHYNFTRYQFRGRNYIKIFPVPRGGLFPALILAGLATPKHNLIFKIVAKPEDADIIIDDILDTGATRNQYAEKYEYLPFFVMLDKNINQIKDFVIFPWEAANGESPAEDNIRRILQAIGEDPKREGLLETPKRVVKSWKEIYSGYNQDPAALLKTFTEGACDEMVILRDIEFYSNCEHHMQPFFGKAHVGYIPNGKVVGISKLARLVEVFARRLQIQERLTMQVTQALDEHLDPHGSACVIEAQHFCMKCRGVLKQNSIMVTSSLTRAFKNDHKTRDEFLKMIRS